MGRSWSMDFMHDQLQDGRTFRLFNMIDEYKRKAIGMEADFSLPAERVIRKLTQMISWGGNPKVIRCESGTEYITAAIQNWAAELGIRLEYIQPGKPQQNAYVERFNRIVRYEWLSQYYWSSIEEVQEFANQWMWTNNNVRPNMVLCGNTPKQKINMENNLSNSNYLHKKSNEIQKYLENLQIKKENFIIKCSRR